MQIGRFQQLAAHRLPCPALEQYVVRHHYGGAAGRLQQAADVLHEIELLVRGRRPEILAVVRQVIAIQLAFLVENTMLLFCRKAGCST